MAESRYIQFSDLLAFIYLFACSLICLFIYVSFNIILFSVKKAKTCKIRVADIYFLHNSVGVTEPNCR